MLEYFLEAFKNTYLINFPFGRMLSFAFLFKFPFLRFAELLHQYLFLVLLLLLSVKEGLCRDNRID